MTIDKTALHLTSAIASAAMGYEVSVEQVEKAIMAAENKPIDLDALEALEKKAGTMPWSDLYGDRYFHFPYSTAQFTKEQDDMYTALRDAIPELIRLARIGQRVERDAKEEGK